MVITKKEFVNRIAEKGNLKKVEANREIELFVETLLDCLKEEGVVKFTGFGKFELKKVRERKGRNLKTGESCIIPEHRKIKFYVSESLTKRINE